MIQLSHEELSSLASFLEGLQELEVQTGVHVEPSSTLLIGLGIVGSLERNADGDLLLGCS